MFQCVKCMISFPIEFAVELDDMRCVFCYNKIHEKKICVEERHDLAVKSLKMSLLEQKIYSIISQRSVPYSLHLTVNGDLLMTIYIPQFQDEYKKMMRRTRFLNFMMVLEKRGIVCGELDEEQGSFTVKEKNE